MFVISVFANESSPAKQAAAEQELISGMRSLFALSEVYPDLKADQSFLELQRELTHTEDRLQSARRFTMETFVTIGTSANPFLVTL